MRSALLEVKGVTRVQVSLENSDAVVTYEPPATAEAMIKAVDAATPVGPQPYKASIKTGPRTNSSS